MTEVVVPIQVETKTVEEHFATQSVPTSAEPINGLMLNGNGTTSGVTTETVTTNGFEKKEVVKVETPKDPTVDPIGWLKPQYPTAVHKVQILIYYLTVFQVNYHILNWTQGQAVPDETKRQLLPGKNEAVTRNQFLHFLRDGTILANLANKLSPGSVEVVHENDAAKEKANQITNIQGFINFAKEKAGLSDEQVINYNFKNLLNFF